jgi:hypothetical protein
MMKAIARCLVVVASLWPMAAHADVIGVGLDFNKGIWVQEYWQDGKPFYLLFNPTGTAVTLSVRQRADNELVAGPWTLAAGAALDVDAGPLQGKDLIKFDLTDKVNLGLLHAPSKAEGQPDKGLVTCLGLNGSGGRYPKHWVEHASLKVSAGDPVELKIVIPADQKQLIVNKKDLPGLEVTCESLKVTQDAQKFTVDVGKATADKPSHTVVVKLTAPKVEKPTLLMFDGFLFAKSGGGHGVTRGIVVLPKASPAATRPVR